MIVTCAESTWRLVERQSEGIEVVDRALLDKLQARGYSIDQSSEIELYLDYRGANAATFLQKDLLLRPDARKIEVLEEYLHNVQNQVGLIDRLIPRQLERHVKEFKLRHRKLLGISRADSLWLANWLEDAKDA